MTAATVTKSVMETYTIRNDHEYATIAVRCWDRSVNSGEDTYYCGEIMINSSFGSWAYIWTACGSPFKEFLQDVEFDYAFGKFMGASLEVFDGDASIEEVKRKVLEERKTGGVDKAEAREVWDEIERIETYSEHGFIESCQWIAEGLGRGQPGVRHPLYDTLFEAWHMVQKKPDIQATGFWRDIWPHFMAELKKETEAVPA